MSKAKIFLLAIAVCLIAQPCFSLSGVPDLNMSVASTAFTGPGMATLLVVPDGSGNPFTEARDSAGNIVDATITLYVLDSSGLSIINYPFEDIWLETSDGGLVFCIGGTTADDNSDVNGMVQWVHPPLAGGFSEGLTIPLVSGSALLSNNGLAVRYNSPDINGDLSVNLQDVSLLAIDYYSGYSFRSDMNSDGVLDLSDIAVFAGHIGVQCP